jgi:hypothetical protein
MVSYSSLNCKDEYEQHSQVFVCASAACDKKANSISKKAGRIDIISSIVEKVWGLQVKTVF